MRRLGWLVMAAVWGAMIPRAEAHFAEDFEEGPTAVRDACWHFDGAAVSSASPISGAYSVRTSPLTSAGDRVIVGPWVALDGFGSLSFRHRVDDLGDGALSLEVIIVDRNGAQSSLWGQTYAATTATTSDIPLPMTGIYRFEFHFAGNGGTARAYLDNVAFPAVEFSDVTTNDGTGSCMPLECLSSLECVGKGDRTLCDFAAHRCVQCRSVNDCEDLDPCTEDRCVTNQCESTDLCSDAGARDDGGNGDGGLVWGNDGGTRDGGRDGSVQEDAGVYVTRPRHAGRPAGGGCAAESTGHRPGSPAPILLVLGLLLSHRRRSSVRR